MAYLRNLGDLIDPARDAGKEALIDLSGPSPRHVTYAALDALADAVARGLLRRGIARGERVGILSVNSTEYLALCYGAQRAGIIPVPVNWRFPPHTVDYVLRDSGTKIVVADTPRMTAVPEGLDAIAFGSREWNNFLDPGPFEPIMPAEREAALFLYTSGSTGQPKGVILSHQAHLWVVEQRLAANDMSGERLQIAAPLYHMNGLALAQLGHAAHATVILLPLFEARAYLEAIGRYRPTWLTAVPPMMAMLLREHEVLAATDTSSVQSIRLGSAPVSASLAAAIRAAFPAARLINAYGTTESGPVVFGSHPEGLPMPELSVGYPHPKVDLRLRAADGTLGDEGVLEQRSPSLMNGYHNRPDLKPPVTEDGFYVTGDVFRRDANGFFTVIGRADDMFISGGENIFPSELERVLEMHPAVAQAAVVSVDDEIKGQKPVAFVVLHPGVEISEATLKEHSLREAPAYMHPRRVWFLPSLPLAGTNKVDKAELRRMAEKRARNHR